jgi:hypothetical protein
MKFPIYFTEEALQEEAEAYLFYEDKQEGLEERFLIEAEASLQRVSENPGYYSYSDETKVSEIFV